MPRQEGLPRLVAHRLEEARRADDVGEHERALHPLRGRAPAELPGQQLRDLLRTIACVGQASAASRSFSSSTLAASTTPALPKSPRCQSNAVGAIVMQLPAPMQRGRSTLARST